MKYFNIVFLSFLIFTSTKAHSQPNYFGVNLAGADFGSNMPGVFNVDYTYPVASELDYYKSKGLLLIRLPFRWERLQPKLGGELDTVELNRLKTIVAAIQNRNMYVVLDMHNSCRYSIENKTRMIGTSEVTVEHIKGFWTKLATVFKDEKNIWGYGIMNEPHDMLNKNHWFSIAQEIINGIRTVDKSTTIVVGGDCWSSAEKWIAQSDNLKKLVDPSGKLIFEAHIYFDKDASGQYRNSYDKENTTSNTGIERANPFVNWLKKNKLRGFIGEYGIPDNDPRWLITLDKLLSYLKDNEINGTYWAAGPWWGNNFMTIEPSDGVTDRPQMSIVVKYPVAK